MNITSPAFFAILATLHAAPDGDARAAALADMMQLAFGDGDCAQAEAARVHLREREGWHVLEDAGGGWAMAPCRALRPRHGAAAVLPMGRA